MTDHHLSRDRSDVIIAPGVTAEVRRLRESSPEAARALMHAIVAVRDGGEPVELYVPGDPPDTKYLAGPW